MSSFTRRTSRPFSIARRSLLPLAAGLALACNILPAAADEADYPVGGTIAVGARVCETIPVDPFWECANAGGTGAIYLVSYAGDVVLTVDEAIGHGGTAVWGEAAGVPMTGYTLHLENAQAPAGYSLYDIYVEPGVDGGAGVNGPYVNLTEQQPSAALYLIYIPDGENPYGDTDTDGDGMVDGAENYHGTDPYDPDTDDDGLGDADDLWVHGTDPSDPDTDGDGTLDGDEVAYGSDPLDPADFPPSVAGPDDDGDGLSAGTEANLGTDPYLFDTDGDGADDGLEFQQGTDPLDAGSFPAEQAGPGPGAPENGAPDADQDGLSNYEEYVIYGTDWTVADTDGDGASDGDEVAYGSDPLDLTDVPPSEAGLDGDGDGLSDWRETEVLGTDPNAADTDGDYLTDYEEVILLGTNPTVADDINGAADADQDGLTNYEELKVYGTAMFSADSDGDGANDGAEVDFGSDPLDAASFPAEQAGPEGDGASDAEGAAAGSDVADAADAPAAHPAPSAPAAAGGNAAVKVTALPNTGAGELEVDTDELAAYAAAAIGAIGLAAAGLAWRRRLA